jgi:hypothetical protein
MDTPENTAVKKVSKKDKIAFARRFSASDWSELTGNLKFVMAFEAGEFEQAAVIAHEMLTSSDYMPPAWS